MSKKKEYRPASDVKKLNQIPEDMKLKLERQNAEQTLRSAGLANGAMYESFPIPILTDGEKTLSGANNAFVRMGRDRPGKRESGYGGAGEPMCGTVDIVVGLAGFKGVGVTENDEKTYANPSFRYDAARAYISQKTDVDINLKLADGSIGNRKGRSAIALKADGLRMVAREGIKLVTGVDNKNSLGEDNNIIRGIDLIAWNDDKDLQPMVKGDNMVACINALVDRVNELNGIVDTLLVTQMKYNAALLTHVHASPFFGLMTTPSPNLAEAGVKCSLDQLLDTKMSIVKHKFNLEQFRNQHLSPAASRYINSRWNNVN